MNENIDLTKILKDCPMGWELYSSIYGNVTFYRIENDNYYPIVLLYYDKDNEKRCGCVTKQGLYEANFYGECTLFPSKDQHDWSKFTAPWYKKERFDPKTLEPFDKVLGRDNVNSVWRCDLFSHIKHECCPYKCVGSAYVYCIPYNEETKHLVGTKEEAPEYYRYWED